MLDVEYAQSSESESDLGPGDFLIEVRAGPSSRSHARNHSQVHNSGSHAQNSEPAGGSNSGKSQGRAESQVRTKGHVRLFALADAPGTESIGLTSIALTSIALTSTGLNPTGLNPTGLAAEIPERDGAANAPMMERMAEGFRSAPVDEPLSVTLGHLMQGVKKQNAAEAAAVVACALCFDRVVVAHTGSAGCYLIRHNHATRLTTRQIKNTDGKGVEDGADEVTDHQILPGDILLLCCAGLPQAIKGSEMATIAGQATDLQAAVKTLLALAKGRSAQGAMSALMIRVRAVERSTPLRSRENRAFR
jgi:hypothetical protein